jgi:ferredoxin-NADP reductase
VTFEIGGVRHHRTYSLSSAPHEHFLRLTVKRHPGGLVSNALHDRLAIGDALVLSPPVGEFVLPPVPPRRMLMLSAGSGITPVMSMLRDLPRRAPLRDVVFVHVCRTQADAIFAGVDTPNGANLAKSAETQIHARSCRVRSDTLAVCGPASFMAGRRAGRPRPPNRLFCERFTGLKRPPRAPSR